MNTREEISNTLEKLNYLSECIIQDIRWLNFGLAIEFDFNYVWDSQGKIRDNLEESLIVSVRFVFVQEFNFRGGLNDSILLNPDYVNWGLNEIAAVKLVDDKARLATYSLYPVPFHLAVITWEGIGDKRQIDIVFSEFEVHQQSR